MGVRAHRIPNVMPDPDAIASGESAEALFVSEFENRVDEKRRLQIPSGWRRGREGMRFLLLPMPKRLWRPACVMVVTHARFMKMVHELRQMRVMDERADSLRRLLSSKSSEVETDSAGRICLPESLAKATDIKDRAMLAGMIDWFEIWNPERYAQLQAGDEERAPEAYAML
jgi:MraZ protein